MFSVIGCGDLVKAIRVESAKAFGLKGNAVGPGDGD